MRIITRVKLLIAGLLFSAKIFASSGDLETKAQHNWPQWRGPACTGVAPYANPPIEWSETKNIRWKIPIPGKGHSTPIIWDNLIFLTSAIPTGEPVKALPESAPGAHDNLPIQFLQKFEVLAINRDDGKIIWQKAVHRELPHEGGHFTGSLASNSPVTDGEHLFAFFGSRGLFCLNFRGEVVWEKDLGKMHTFHAHGEGSSPALFEDTLLVNWDHQGDSFLYAFKKTTGEQLWKVPRDEITSWSTPFVLEHQGKPQVIVSATNRVRSYDLISGKVIWECSGLSRNVVSSPVGSDGMVFVGSSYDTQAMLAINLNGATGNITGSEKIVWSQNKHTPYVPSPLLYKEALYFLKHNQGILSSIEAKTGKKRYDRFRLNGIRNVFSSPIGAANRIYITDRDGLTMVLNPQGEELKILAKNQLDDSFSASAAVVDRNLFLRGERYLYCISEPYSDGSKPSGEELKNFSR